MDLFQGSIPQDDQIMNLPLDTDRTRGDKPVRNPLELTGMTGPGRRSLLQREVSTVVKGSRAQIVLTEPRRCQVTGIEVEGTVTDTRANIPFRCCDCGIRMATGHNSVMTEDKDKDPGPIRTYPVKTECAPISGETVILRPMNLLEVPALRLPGVFLKLAEEARKSEVMDDQQAGMSAVKLHRSGQAGRVMITEITDSFPVLGSGASRVSQTSTEVIPDLNLVEPVIRLGPVGHLRNTEQPVILRVETNQGTISPPGPVGQHVLIAGHMEMMVRRDPVGPYEESEPSVSQGMISPPGPVGQHVLMAGHMEMMVQPDPVVPYEETEPSVSPGLDAGQVEQLPSSQVLPGVEMSHIQPVADGPAGLVRTRHPAGTVMPPVIQDGVRLLAGGPVGQFPDPRFHISSKDSSPDNSYQPLVTGPSGANMSDASYDAGPRLVGDPLDRSTSVDPMGPREMLSLGDGIPPASMGPVGRPLMTGQLMTGQLMRQTKEPDWTWSTPPRSASECDAESLHSVIRTEEEVYTGSVNTSVATGRAEPSEVLVLSDSVIFSPGAQIHRIEEGSESATVKPDPTIRTGGEGRTDDVNFDTNNGQSGSSVVSPSSDSGVHSLDEHWECMSTVSGDSDSIQSIITVYDGVVCEADSPPVRIRNVLTRGIVSSRGGTYGKDDSMSDLSSNGRNSDIAAMSDFSEEEDEAWEEVGPCGDEQPNIRTNCVGKDTIDSGGHSVLPATPTAVTHNVMEQHDEEYWTNFRLLAKQAFKLDDVKLAASSYPDAVKELVVRSRLTIENYPSTDDDSDSDSDTDTSYYECPLKVEYKDGWQINTYTDGPDKKYYTNKAVGHDLTLEMDIEDKLDVCSEPDARATFELSPTKHVVALDNIGVNCITDGDVTVISGNVDGDSDMHDDEFIRVSMISVDETRRDTSVNIHSSLGTRECVIPECVIQPTLVAYGDSALCNKESLHIMRKYCFGLCGLTNQFYSTEFEWCVECVNRLIWGFLVSCVVSIVMRNRSVGTDVLSKGSDVIVSIWGLLDGLVILCDAMRECVWTLKDINDPLNNVMMGNRARMISHDIPWGEDNGQVRATRASVDISPIRVRGRFGCLGRPVQGADWLDVRPVDGGPVGTDIWIKYIGDSFSRYQSSDAAPLTEVQDIYITLHFNTKCFAGLCSIRIVSLSVRITRSLEEVIRCGGVLSLCQTMDGAALADDRSGITFTADLCVPWDAPEAVVDMNSTDLISLGPFPDKVGLVGRRKDAAMSRIMKGRDCRSVRFVVPDVHLVDRGFHDVTVVDMGDDREPTIVLQDMTRLRELWPVEVFDQMKSRQQDLELMRKSAKKNYQQVRPMPCRFCGKVIRVDMYRHVARLHLDLVQLWRCPIAWCTTWKGSPQDCLEHVRSGHDAPWVEKTASIERYAPPWTVSRQLWMDSLRIEHSGISTDMLLFSEVGMPLTQHYRVYKGGLPHAVFRTDYLPRLRTLLPSPGGTEDPSVIGNGSTPTSVRRQRRMSRPTRLFPDSATDMPILTEQHPSAMVGKTVIDCRPSILPVSIPISGWSPETISEARNCVSYQQLEESGRSIMNMDTNEISIDRIVGFAWNDGGTDVEDELPSPVLSPVRIVSPSITPADSADPVGGVENFDMDLAKVLCDVSVLPSLVTPLVEEEAAVGGTVADYAPPAAPVIEPVESSPFVPDSAADTSLDGGFLQLLREPREPLTVTPPVSPMVADTSTPAEGPDSQRETLPIPSISPILPTGAVHADTGPDLSREGPFNAYDVVPDAGQSPVVMDSMAGCQYRMTSYEERVTDSDMNPSYGIHMHDPRVIEYMGAPESARLMGRTPEYWLQHMGRERTIQAALRLHHDASLIMTNIQIMSQLATSFSRAASEVMRTIHDREPFPTEAVDLVTPGRQVRRAAHYMAAMGLWRPTSAPVFPGPVSASSCNSCMACDDCFPDGGK